MEKTDKEQQLVSNFVADGLMFYLPLWYAIKSRFMRRTRIGFAFWSAEYLIPTIIALILCNVDCISWCDMALSIITIYSFYELGYIQNDCETIKKESKPTMRLVPSELAFYERNKINIYLFRYALCIYFTYYYIVHGASISEMIIMWAVVPFYWLYNTVRGRITDYLILILMLYRYCMPLFLYCADVDCRLVWLVAFSYPVCTFIQYGVRGKFGKPEPWGKLFFKNYEKRDEFRIWYYVVLIILSSILVYYDYMNNLYSFLLFYYLLFRIVSYGLRAVMLRS